LKTSVFTSAGSSSFLVFFSRLWYNRISIGKETCNAWQDNIDYDFTRRCM
jgi:hypothetical protein